MPILLWPSLLSAGGGHDHHEHGHHAHDHHSEGKTTLSKEALKVADISIEKAGPQTIVAATKVFGRLLLNEDKVAHLRARFPGIVRQINKKLGDPVSKGDLLALVESNQSLQPYEIRSQISGKVIRRHAVIGEFVTEATELFVVADLSEVWADFQVYRDNSTPIREGEPVEIHLGNDSPPINALISYVSPLTDIITQSKLVRAVLPNPDGVLRPGLFVSGTLSKAEAIVPVAVTREAIQSYRDQDVVFATDGHNFEARPVTIGRKDARYAEVLSGINAGDRYVGKNSFVIKADIEKSEASHDH